MDIVKNSELVGGLPQVLDSGVRRASEFTFGIGDDLAGVTEDGVTLCMRDGLWLGTSASEGDSRHRGVDHIARVDRRRSRDHRAVQACSVAGPHVLDQPLIVGLVDPHVLPGETPVGDRQVTAGRSADDQRIFSELVFEGLALGGNDVELRHLVPDDTRSRQFDKTFGFLAFPPDRPARETRAPQGYDAGQDCESAVSAAGW